MAKLRILAMLLVVVASFGILAATIKFWRGSNQVDKSLLSGDKLVKRSAVERLLESDWPTYHGESYTFQYPPGWLVSTTTFGGIQITSYSQDDEPSSTDQIRLLISPLNHFLNCTVSNVCFDSLASFVKYFGYPDPTTTTVGGYPALESPSLNPGAIELFVQEGDGVINIAYSPAQSTQLSTTTEILDTFRSE